MASTSSRNGPEQGPLCDIVIPIWNQPERTGRCLESILAETTEPVRLILIDNGSEAPTRELLDRFQVTRRCAEAPGGVISANASRYPVQIIRNKENLGFIRGVNQGIRASNAPWICLLNNDTIVSPGWLTELLRVGQGNPSIGLINPTSNSLGYNAGSNSPAEVARLLKSESGRWTELTTALGFCLFSRRALYDQVGLLDESFGMGYFDDDDLSRRVRKAGLLCVRACAAYVYHEEQVSFKELPGWKKTFEENRSKFHERWGRPLRILWAMPSANPRSMEIAARRAQEGHWITFITPAPIPDAQWPSQAQLNRLELPAAGWKRQTLLKLIIRRKKPFDLLVSEEPSVSRWAGRLGWLHHARILNKPDEKDLIEQCRKLSLSPS